MNNTKLNSQILGVCVLMRKQTNQNQLIYHVCATLDGLFWLTVQQKWDLTTHAINAINPLMAHQLILHQSLEN